MVLMRQRPSAINRWPTWTLFLETWARLPQPTHLDLADGRPGRKTARTATRHFATGVWLFLGVKRNWAAFDHLPLQKQ